MDNKIFISSVNNLKSLMELPNTFCNRRKVKKARKEINKMIKLAARAQANIVYNQTCELYQEILNSNLE